MRFFAFLQNMDRRIAYILLAVVVGVSLYPPPWLGRVLDIPLKGSPAVRKAYNTVEKTPTNKVAFVSIWWSASTVAENRSQMEVVVRHLFKRGVPVAIIPWDPMGATLAYNKVKQIADEMGKKYGVDWVAFGYTPAFDQVVYSMRTNIQAALKKDREGTPVSQIPMMKDKKDAQDIGLVVETTPSGTIPTWISYLGQPKHIPIIYGPTGVMIPEGYNYLDAGQIKGMLPGLVGAAQYEVLLRQKSFASRATNALSTSHVMTIVLIILGNIGFFAWRRRSNELQR